MPANAKVLVHYGPYESCGIVDHRAHRLHGLQNVLERDRHTVELLQVNDRNLLELWINGEMIFTCDITDLDFGGDGLLDPLCAEALERVRRAF